MPLNLEEAQWLYDNLRAMPMPIVFTVCRDEKVNEIRLAVMHFILEQTRKLEGLTQQERSKVEGLKG